MFLQRELRTRFDLLRPDTAAHMRAKQSQQKSDNDLHAQKREFVVGDSVFGKNFRSGPHWVHTCYGYLLETTDQQVWRRHVDQVNDQTRSPVPTSQSSSSEETTWVLEQLVPGAVLPTPAPRPAVHTEPVELSSAIPETTPPDETPQTEPRYPTRDRRAPNYFRPETRFFLLA